MLNGPWTFENTNSITSIWVFPGLNKDLPNTFCCFISGLKLFVLDHIRRQKTNHKFYGRTSLYDLGVSRKYSKTRFIVTKLALHQLVGFYCKKPYRILCHRHRLVVPHRRVNMVAEELPQLGQNFVVNETEQDGDHQTLKSVFKSYRQKLDLGR